MPSREPRDWEEHLARGLIEEGALPDDALEALSSQPGGHHQRHKWLLVERLLGSSQAPLPARLQAPSPEEIARGARMVLARLGTPNTQNTQKALDIGQTPKASARQVALEEPAIGPPLVPEEPKSSADPAGLWSRLVPLYAGALALVLVLFVARQAPDLLPSQPGPSQTRPTPLPGISLRPYIGIKGQGGTRDPAWLRLFFGVSPAHLAQPQRRGRVGMQVQPGEWLYFLFEKAPMVGYLTLLQVVPNKQALHKDTARITQLFPAPGQRAAVSASQRKWVLSVGNVALRYPVPGGTGAARGLAFMGLFTSQPLPPNALQKLQQVVSQWRYKKAVLQGISTQQREGIATQLGISARRVAAFHVVIGKSAHKQEPQPRQVPR